MAAGLSMCDKSVFLETQKLSHYVGLDWFKGFRFFTETSMWEKHCHFYHPFSWEW
jgi:hypothetical protein